MLTNPIPANPIPANPTALALHGITATASRAGQRSTGTQGRGTDGATPPLGELWLTRLSGGELVELPASELAAVLAGIEQHINKVTGYRIEVLATLKAAGRRDQLPNATPRETLRDATGVSDRDAREMLRVADKAQEHPTVMEALNDGEINARQAESLSDARVPEHVREQLVADAVLEGTDQTRSKVRAAETAHSRETAEQRFQRQRGARAARWGTDDEGMLKIWAKLDPETGARVEASLSAIGQALWRADKSLRGQRRTPAQRDADALAFLLSGVTLTPADEATIAELFERQTSGADRGSPQLPRVDELPEPTDEPTDITPSVKVDELPEPTGKPTDITPSVTVDELPEPTGGSADITPSVTSADNPHGQPNVRPQSRPPLRFDDVSRRLPDAQIQVTIEYEALRGACDKVGLTDAGTELSGETVRRLACDAQLIPMVLGGPGGCPDVGRSRRIVPKRLRRALIQRDRCCVWPGCSAPPSRCDAHHIWHWIDGGPTNLDNLALLCHAHHHHLHKHNLQLLRNPDSSWTVRDSKSCSAPPSESPKGACPPGAVPARPTERQRKKRPLDQVTARGNGDMPHLESLP